MTYNQWLTAVESLTTKQKPPLRLNKIDPDALRKAFDNGMSPAIFAKQPSIPPIAKGQTPAKPTKPKDRVTIPVLIALFALAAPVAMLWRSIIESKREDAVAVRLTAGNQLKLPVQTDWGLYMPKQASEAEQWVESYIRDQMLDPGSAEITECAPTILARNGVTVEGEVYGKSTSGVRMRSAFKVRVSHNPVTWANTKVDHTKWYVMASSLEGDAQANIWRPLTTGQRVSNAPFQQQRTAAKRVVPIQRVYRSPVQQPTFPGSADYR